MPSRLSTVPVACLFLMSAVAGVLAQDSQFGALYERGADARKLGRYPQALELLRQAETLEPTSADVQVQLGYTLLGLGDLENSRASFQRALALAPDYVDARLGLTEIALRRGDLAAAQSHIRLATELAPVRPDVIALSGMVEARASDSGPNDSTKIDGNAAEKQSRSGPAVESAGIAQANAFRFSGRYDEARDVYSSILLNNPEDVDATLGIGLTLASEGRFDEADQKFREVLALAPNYLDAKLGLVRSDIARRDFDAAAEKLDGLDPENANSAEPLILYAQLETATGNLDAAETRWRKVLAVDPENETAIRGLSELQAARRLGSPSERSRRVQTVSAPIPVAGETQPDQTPWRFDLSTEISHLTNGRPRWFDSRAVISRRINEDTTLGATLRDVKRGDLRDLQVGAFIYHSLTDDWSLYSALALTPDAEVLADAALEVAISVTPFDALSALTGTAFTLGARGYAYEGADTFSLSPEVFVPLGPDFDLQLKYTYAFATDGNEADSVSVRFGYTPTEKLKFFAGWTKGSELDEATPIQTESFFVGGQWLINERYALTGSFSKEFRSSFDRETIGLSFGVRF